VSDWAGLLKYANITNSLWTFNSIHATQVVARNNKRESMPAIEDKIRTVAHDYACRLKEKIDARMEEMKKDDDSHHLIYQVLGITDREGHLIDIYQNKGRFLYKYAGSFLEEAAKLCFAETYPEFGSLRIPNTVGQRPKTFEIDCVVETEAIEIKWRDATTDGDHIAKEHARLKATRDAGYKPIRIMFYYPQRVQAMRIQETLETLYKGADGEYHFGDNTWAYIRDRTNVDLLSILKKLAKENAK